MRNEYKRLLNIGMDEDHLKALRMGQRVMTVAVVFLAATIIAAVMGYSGVTWAVAGLSLALFVVGLMLIFESERQRRRSGGQVSPRGQVPPVRG